MPTRNEGLSSADFNRLRTLIYHESGINLSSDKKTMMEIRIKRRLRSLQIPSFREYCGRLFGHEGRKHELVFLIDVITTNKTDFFRESAHFDYLVSKALPDLAARKGVNPRTGEAVKIKASKAPKFSAGAGLKAAVSPKKK